MSIELARLLQDAAGRDAARREAATAPARVFGPRPPARVRDLERAPRGPRLMVLLVPLVLVAGFGLARGDTNGGARGCHEATVDAPAGAQIVRGDTTGSGCLSTGVYADGVLTIRTSATDARPRQFALGRSGDELALGDWDCDGVATPALFRPSTNETFYFDSWTTETASRACACSCGNPVDDR
jgi:hypothetical protein